MLMMIYAGSTEQSKYNTQGMQKTGPGTVISVRDNHLKVENICTSLKHGGYWRSVPISYPAKCIGYRGIHTFYGNLEEYVKLPLKSGNTDSGILG